MIIIGISGKKQSGKSTIAAHIKSLFPNRVYEIAFADALKDEVCLACKITREYMELNKKDYRFLLQAWGTDYRRRHCGEDYWIKQWINKALRVPDEAIVIAPDVRFINEAIAVRSCGGKLWRVDKIDINVDDHHESETELDTFRFSTIISNDDTIESLKAQINILVKTQQIK